MKTQATPTPMGQQEPSSSSPLLDSNPLRIGNRFAIEPTVDLMSDSEDDDFPWPESDDEDAGDDKEDWRPTYVASDVRESLDTDSFQSNQLSSH
jgi:hypothetical protein